MRTLAVGDVHGCAGPLRALLELANPDRVLLLGDIFAKGPDPKGVWDLIRAWDARAILGNHDAKLLEVWGQPGDSAHHACWPHLPAEARAWIAELPTSLAEGDWTAVHAGVHPTLGLEGTTRKQLLTLRRWPDDADLENPFWWELYTGPRRIIYGHDAMRGIQDHGRTVGLDTGCVYGGMLSGMILEDGELLQVRGRGRHAPSGGPGPTGRYTA